jgi:hypothetical protein
LQLPNQNSTQECNKKCSHYSATKVTWRHQKKISIDLKKWESKFFSVIRRTSKVHILFINPRYNSAKLKEGPSKSFDFKISNTLLLSPIKTTCHFVKTLSFVKRQLCLSYLRDILCQDTVKGSSQNTSMTTHTHKCNHTTIQCYQEQKARNNCMTITTKQWQKKMQSLQQVPI